MFLVIFGNWSNWRPGATIYIKMSHWGSTYWDKIYSPLGLLRFRRFQITQDSTKEKGQPLSPSPPSPPVSQDWKCSAHWVIFDFEDFKQRKIPLHTNKGTATISTSKLRLRIYLSPTKTTYSKQRWRSIPSLAILLLLLLLVASRFYFPQLQNGELFLHSICGLLQQPFWRCPRRSFPWLRSQRFLSPLLPSSSARPPSAWLYS